MFRTSSLNLALIATVIAPLGVGSQSWESKMISSGANRPLLQIGRAPWRDGLIALRLGGGEPADSVIEALIGEGVARREAGAAVPTCMVASRRDGEVLGRHATATARAFLPELLAHLDLIRPTLRDDPRFAAASEADLALLVYSDVLLDNWQINGVEAEWLGAKRPARAGGRYYCAAFERDDASGTEPFGIWGNASRSTPGWRIGVYGNDRRRPGLHNVSGTALALSVGLDTAAIARDRRLEVAIDSLAAMSHSGTANAAYAKTARQLGFWQGGRSTLLVLPATASERFSKLAAALRPALVGFLKGTDSSLTDLQEQAGYQSLESAEFRIWWYHFFYTALTRELVSRGIVPPDQASRVTYLIRRLPG